MTQSSAPQILTSTQIPWEYVKPAGVCVWSVLAHAMVGLASLEFLVQAGKLETQAGISAAVLRQNSFSRKPQFLPVRPSN